MLLQLAVLCAIAMLAGGLHAQASVAASYGGAWRLDDGNSDSADTVKRLLREAGQSAAAPAAASSTGASTPAARPGQGGHRGGGMGRGGMGGGGMGGHGGRGGKGGRGGETAKDEKGEDFRGDYPLPPTLEHDNVLLVQQDTQSIQVRFADGSAMDVRLDGQSRQTLAGNAMVSARRESDGLHVSIQYADGSKLDQRWMLAPDGKQLTVLGEWRAPGMAQPVSFRRGYVGLP
ncbi:hypothetical protein RKE25_21690 [Dyella sp. BiH032]|uniref:hypothetical protein n=1 Tax=Dyella sp. BiH032 TaxID=3075430 RepID=UPI002892B555|nr:hypothetical protein [Dyella sp. BiH032]WNL45990.1 hypothetical protein RKE25_21690 [Dyella sp. BiH032]